LNVKKGNQRRYESTSQRHAAALDIELPSDDHF